MLHTICPVLVVEIAIMETLIKCNIVIPAKAGIQSRRWLDSGLRRNDGPNMVANQTSH